MATKDLHEDPFDETTITKLEIFEDYAQAWIPTFVMKGTPTICIFDFFAGTGYDKNGIPGSPIRILEKIREQLKYIFQKNVKIKVYLNEYEPNRSEQKKFHLLQTACKKFLEDNKAVGRAIGEINFYNQDFSLLFPQLIDKIKAYPSLVYLDQNGIKYLSDKYLLELEKTTQTDFLYFVSASYFWRFGNSREFREHIDIDMSIAKKDPYNHILKNLILHLRKKLPVNTKLKIYPFSLKKGANIYGIIFGASHPRAVDKFLSIAWKRNEVNGQANFDIDGESGKSQLDIFNDRKLTKLEEFEKTFTSKVLSKDIKNNYEALSYVHQEGHIGAHAAQCLRDMKKKGVIYYEGPSPLVTYENVYKNLKELSYQIKADES